VFFKFDGHSQQGSLVNYLLRVFVLLV
jgi:hypothetical protein